MISYIFYLLSLCFISLSKNTFYHSNTNFILLLNLRLTHGLNGIRNTAKNIIQESVGGRKDYKVDSLAADFKDWEISW